jgi:preprotein translocase subunit SecG
MENTLMVINLVVSALIVLLVLMQFGKGAEAGLMSGGASDAVFSAAQKGNILSRITTVLVVIFLVNSIVMAKIQGRNTSESLLDKNAPITKTSTNPTLPLNAAAAPAPDQAAPKADAPKTAPKAKK